MASGPGWGILATGGIAHAFTKDLRTAGLRVAAVGSRTKEGADRFAAEYAIPHAHGSYEALVEDPAVDVVYVATPHPSHAENAILALQHGKHVLVEKAFTLNADEARDVQDVAQARGLVAMEAMWTRYLPGMMRLRELVRGGALGELRTVSADHQQKLPTDPAHRLNDLALGGGALLDLGIYPISFAVDMLGLPVSVKAVGRLGETGADTEVATVAVHAGGAISTSLSSSRAAGPNVASVVGTDARVDLDRTWYNATTWRLVAPDGTVLEVFEPRNEGRGMQFEALAAEEAIATGDAPELPIAETVAIMGVLDDIRAQLDVHYPQER